MKKHLIILFALLMMSSITYADANFGLGLGMIFSWDKYTGQNYTYDESVKLVDSFTSIGINLFMESRKKGRSTGYFIDMTGGIILGSRTTLDMGGSRISDEKSDLDNMDLRIQLSILSGIGGSFFAGPVEIYLGAGPHFGMYQFRWNDFKSDVGNFSLGIGAEVCGFIPINPIKLRVGFQVNWDIIRLFEGSSRHVDIIEGPHEAFQSLIIVPSVSMIF